MNLRHASDEYLHHLRRTRTLSEHTLRAYRCDLSSLAAAHSPELDVSELTPDAILGDIERRRSRGTSAASLRRRASTYRGFCRWLAKTDAVANDPFISLSIRLKSPRRLPRPIGEIALCQLLDSLCRSADFGPARAIRDHLPEPDEGITLTAISIMLATGLRVGEVVSISVLDIDLGDGSIRVLGKGQRERQVYLTNQWISDLVATVISTREFLAIAHDKLLFNRKGAPMTTAALRMRLARAAEQAGVEERLTPHMLRHTAATQLIESGVDIRFVQRLLGHASLTTTELYTHVADSTLRRVVTEADVLGRALASRTLR